MIVCCSHSLLHHAVTCSGLPASRALHCAQHCWPQHLPATFWAHWRCAGFAGSAVRPDTQGSRAHSRRDGRGQDRAGAGIGCLLPGKRVPCCLTCCMLEYNNTHVHNAQAVTRIPADSCKNVQLMKLPAVGGALQALLQEEPACTVVRLSWAASYGPWCHAAAASTAGMSAACPAGGVAVADHCACQPAPGVGRGD